MIRVYCYPNVSSIIGSVVDTFTEQYRDIVRAKLYAAMDAGGVTSLLERCAAFGCDIVLPEREPDPNSSESVQVVPNKPNRPYDPNVIDLAREWLAWSKTVTQGS